MASVEKKVVVTEVVLTLSVNEANALACALGSTAGDAREIESLWDCLDRAGFSGEGFRASAGTPLRVDKA